MCAMFDHGNALSPNLTCMVFRGERKPLHILASRGAQLSVAAVLGQLTVGQGGPPVAKLNKAQRAR